MKMGKQGRERYRNLLAGGRWVPREPATWMLVPYPLARSATLLSPTPIPRLPATAKAGGGSREHRGL